MRLHPVFCRIIVGVAGAGVVMDGDPWAVLRSELMPDRGRGDEVGLSLHDRHGPVSASLRVVDCCGAKEHSLCGVANLSCARIRVGDCLKSSECRWARRATARGAQDQRLDGFGIGSRRRERCGSLRRDPARIWTLWRVKWRITASVIGIGLKAWCAGALRTEPSSHRPRAGRSRSRGTPRLPVVGPEGQSRAPHVRVTEESRSSRPIRLRVRRESPR